MVSDSPSLSRRRLLGGLAAGTGLLGGGAVTVGATRPTALPNVVADLATNNYPTPPAPSSLWQPTVTEAHAREAVSMLAETETAANERWAEIDEPDARLIGSGGWLSNAEEDLENGDYNDALFDARYGMQFAAEELGEARARLGEADLEALADRSVAVFERVDAVVDAIERYPVRDPGRDLAWYVEIELEAQRARHLADWRGLEEILDDGETSAVSAADPYDVGEITSQLRRAEIAVETAERYRDRLLEDVGDADREYRSRLQGCIDEFWTELESIPTRDEVQSRYIEEDAYGPYEFAHRRLAQACFPSNFSPPWEHRLDDEFLAARALGSAKGLVDWRAHERTVADLAVSPDDETFDPGHVLAEKRRARSTYREEIGPDPAPFAVILAEEAIGSIHAADIRRDSWARGSWTPWRERLQAYLQVRLGRARLREYPTLYDRIVTDG